MLLVGAQAPATALASTAPDYGSLIAGPDCGTPQTVTQYPGDGIPGVYWSSRGYVGSAVYGSSYSWCDGRFPYSLSISSGPATYQMDWIFWPQVQSTTGLDVVCRIWAYIPTADAGGLNAHYHVYGLNNNWDATWLFWANVNQELSSGWVYLGEHGLPGGDNGVDVHLDNIEAASPGWDVAFDAVAVHCFTVSSV